MKHQMNPWDNGVILRPWDEEDGPAMADLHRRAILATTDEFYSQEQRESWAHGLDGKGYAKSAADGEIYIIAVDEDDKPLGFCGFKGNEICGLYVDPDHQGKGIGYKLALRAIANITQTTPDKLIIDSSLPAVGFYEQFGYRKVKEVTHDTRGGVKLPAFDMETDPIEYSQLIGPHEGRELKLMLEGKKRLAWYPEMDPTDAFFEHVESGEVHRFVWHDYARNFYEAAKDHMPPSTPWPEPVFYYLPGEEERMHQLIELIVEQISQGGPGVSLERERKIGELLDYPTEAIDAFIAEMQTRATKGEATILDN